MLNFYKHIGIGALREVLWNETTRGNRFSGVRRRFWGQWLLIFRGHDHTIIFFAVVFLKHKAMFTFQPSLLLNNYSQIGKSDENTVFVRTTWVLEANASNASLRLLDQMNVQWDIMPSVNTSRCINGVIVTDRNHLQINPYVIWSLRKWIILAVRNMNIYSRCTQETTSNSPVFIRFTW
jgi:hypothetical protein